MAGNSNLTDSSRNKQDEFYTKLTLIEDELKHYRKFFEGKTVLCNCDDPFESNFFKFFAMNFNAFKLKKLMATCYAESPVIYTQLSLEDTPERADSVESEKKCKPYKVVIEEVKDENGDGRVDLADVEYLLKNKKNILTLLEGNGSFDSDECRDLLKEADVVVTNPPFSKFRQYVALLLECKKDFLIIGNMNACTYKEIFPLLQQNKIWLGYQSGHFWFKVPSYYKVKKTDFKIDDHGQKWRRMGNICWFTNIDIEKRHENMVLFKHYTPREYPKYDNEDIIEVNRTTNIPCDYYGMMGVPITFLDKYNPDQFEIIWLDGSDTNVWYGSGPSLNGKKLYRRIIIRRRHKG